MPALAFPKKPAGHVQSSRRALPTDEIAPAGHTWHTASIFLGVGVAVGTLVLGAVVLKLAVALLALVVLSAAVAFCVVFPPGGGVVVGGGDVEVGVAVVGGLRGVPK